MANDFGLDFLPTIRSYMIPPLYAETELASGTTKLEEDNSIVRVYHGGSNGFEFGYLPFQLRQVENNCNKKDHEKVDLTDTVENISLKRGRGICILIERNSTRGF